MANKQNLNIAIIGGGICGLTVAVALQKMAIKAHVFEATTQFGEIGAGIGIGKNGMNILREIGVYDEISKYLPDSRKTSTLGFMCAMGYDINDHIYTLATEDKKSTATLLRSQFRDALAAHIDPEYTHFNKRCISITSDPSTKVQTIHFTDGTTAEADVVLVANGIKSSIRDALVANGTGLGLDVSRNAFKCASFSNSICYRGLVYRENAEALGVDTSMWQRPMLLIGQDKHVVVYPVQKGQLINVVAFQSEYSQSIGSIQLSDSLPSSEPATIDELLTEFSGSEFCHDVIALFKCIEKPTKWYIHIVYPHLSMYAQGRVALLGDAAHGMFPHLGAGAGQGVEDAYLLAQLLSHSQTTVNNVEEVLQVYSDIRRPRSQHIQDLSIRAGQIYQGRGSHGLEKEGLKADVADIDSWLKEVYLRPVNQDLEQAVNTLRSRGTFV